MDHEFSQRLASPCHTEAVPPDMPPTMAVFGTAHQSIAIRLQEGMFAIMKAIFLDIDGVMATDASYYAPRHKWFDKTAYPFRRECVAVLNEALAVTGAEIVLSSSWRISYPYLDALDRLFKFNGVRKSPVGVTANFGFDASGSHRRGKEILSYVAGSTLENYVALDDWELEGLAGHFVHIDELHGLTRVYLPHIVAILTPCLSDR